MKLLIVSHSAVVPVYREKYQIMARQGHEVHLVLPYTWPEGGRDIVAPESGVEKRVYIHRLKGGFYGRVGGFYLKRLSRFIRLIHPDLIYAEEEPYAIISWQLIKLAAKHKIPFSFFTWENIVREYKVPLNWIDRKVLKKAAYAIVGNQEGLHVLKQRGYRGGVSVIPQYGVDPDFFQPGVSKIKKNPEPFVIGYLGRLLPEKGIDTLIEAMNAVSENVTLRIIGAGFYRKQLEKMVQEKKLKKRISFEPAIANDKVPEVLQQLDALVLPSKTTADWKEQFGRILIEAMACQVPVIGSDSGEIPFVIADGGLIFQEGNAEELAAHISHFWEHPKKAKEFGLAGRKRVLKKYTTKQIVLTSLQLFGNIIRRSKQR